MTKTLCVLGLSALLLTGVAGGSFAANESGDSQTVTGTHLANPQVAAPATGGGRGGMGNPTGTASVPQTSVPASPDAARPAPLSNSNEGGGGGAGGAGGGAAR